MKSPRKLKSLPSWKTSFFSTSLVAFGMFSSSIASAQKLEFKELPGQSGPATHQQTPGSLQPLVPSVVNSGAPISNAGSGRVQQVGFTSAAPVAPVASYRLVGHSWQEFEQKLVSCWLKQPQAEVSDEGRKVKVTLPNTKSAAYMTIDRGNSTIDFHGSAEAAAEWKALMSVLDLDKSTGISKKIEVAPLPPAGPEIVTSAATIMGVEIVTPQNMYASTFNPAQQDEQILPGDPQVSPNTRVITRTQDAQGNEFSGPVQIQVFPELDAIVIIGPPEDVAEVRAMIDQLMQQAKETSPKVARVPLQGSDPQSTAEIVQQLYDNIYAPTLGNASIQAIRDPRGLLVSGREESIQKIREIVKEYDVPEEPMDVEPNFRSFKLKFISANDAKSRVDEYFSQASNTLLAEPGTPIPVVTISDFRSNTLIVKGAKVYFDQVEQLLNELDVDGSGAVNVVRVFPLKNSLAETMAIVLQDAINGQLPNAGRSQVIQNQAFGQQQQLGNFNQQGSGQSSIRSPSLQLMTVDRDGNDVRGGIMFDVRVTPNAGNNSLVVAGPKAAMGLIEALIDQLDTIPNAETQIKVFRILNGDAQTLLSMLETLFSSQSTQGAQGGAFGGGGLGQATGGMQLPLQSAGATAGITLANLQFSFDQRTNSIIASGSVGDLQVVEALLTRLDEREVNSRLTVVIRMSNAPVLDVADSVNAWLESRQADITAADPTYINPITQSRRFVIVEPETVSNSLIVSALPEYMDEVISVIRALDRRPPTIKIKVMIASVDLSMLEEFGVDMGFQDSILFDRGIGTIGYPFNQAGIGNSVAPASLATREVVGGQGLSNLGTGRINSELNYGGLVLSAGNESINLLLRALQDKQCARVLSKPSIMTIENQQGRVQIGQTVARIRDVSQTNFGITNGIEDVDIGVILEVTPRVSQDGMIVMFLNATKSSLGPESQGVPIFVNANGQITRSPNIDKIEAQTTIMARSGQTVVFSGLIEEEKSKFQRGVPVLSSLPLLGPLFRFEGEKASRSELLIIMTPYLCDSDEDIEAMNTDDMDRMHWCLSDVAEVYGSTNYDPSPVYTSPKVFYPDVDPMGLQPEIQTPGSLPQDHNSGSYEAPVGSSQMQQPVSYSIPRSQGEDTNQVDNTRSRPVELGLQTENDAAPMEVFVRKIDDSEGQTVKTVSHEPMQVETANFNSPDPRRKNQKNGFQVFSKSKQENESGFISNPYASQGQGQTR